MLPIRLLIADDHAIVRQGLRTFLETFDDLEVIAEAGDGRRAVELITSLDPDVALLDLVMPGLDGAQVTRELRAAGIETPVLVLTSFPGRGHVLRAVRAGASGYVLKDVEPSQLVEAIRAVASGKAYLDPEVTGTIMQQVITSSESFNGPYGELTEREREVLELITQGQSNAGISAELNISEKTVKSHVSNILAKLGADDRTQAALYAVKEGWFRP